MKVSCDDVALERLLADGYALEGAGQYSSALERYRRATAAAPHLARGWMNVGNALRALGRPDEARAAYWIAIEREPQDAKAYFNLGLLMFEQEDDEAAERALSE